jgi:hypothetical protein
LLKTISAIIIGSFEGYKHTIINIIINRTSIRLTACSDVQKSGFGEPAPFGFWLEDSCKIMQASRIECEPIIRTVKASSICYRCHLNSGFGAVGKRIIHFRIEITGRNLLITPAKIAPNSVWG